MMSYRSRFDYTVKVLLLGDHNVGKSSLMADVAQMTASGGGASKASSVRCVNFLPSSHAELDFARRGKKILVKLVDTGGQERFRSITASFYRGAQGCLILFDAENSDTFMNVSKWHEDLEIYSSFQPMTAFLVGLNTDSKARQVTPDQAELLATKLGMQYHQVKAKFRIKLLEVIEDLLDALLVHASRLPSITLDIHPSLIQSLASFSPEDKKKKFKCSC